MGPSPNIAVLVDSLWHDYGGAVWRGIQEELDVRRARAVCFDSQATRSINAVDPDALTSGGVDGVIILAAGYPEKEEAITRLAERLPTVTIGRKVPSVPHVVVDNESGIVAAVSHLVGLGRRRIGFIRGPQHSPNAEARFAAYRRSLAEAGLLLDPELVAPGAFVERSGATAVRTLIDERGAAPDALIAANDAMAIGALRALQRRGLNVPGDVALVGFDDLSDALACTPPLTTVRQPARELGRTAAALVMNRIGGLDVPEQTMCKTRLIVRASSSASPAEALVSSPEPLDAGWIERERAALASRMRGALPHESATQAMLESLVEALANDALAGTSTFDKQLVRALRDEEEVSELLDWYGALTTLITGLLPSLETLPEARARAQAAWRGAIATLNDRTRRVHARLEGERRYEADDLGTFSDCCARTSDGDDVHDALEFCTSHFGLRAVVVTLFDDDPHWSRVLFSSVKSAAPLRFRTRQILPEGFLEPYGHVTVYGLSNGKSRLGLLFLQGRPVSARSYPTLAARLEPALARVIASGTLESAITEERRAPRFTQFGRYRVLRQLGAGGSGTVYLAEHEVVTGVFRQVALKVIRLPEGEHAHGTSAHLVEEVRVAAALRHANVVPVLEAGVYDDQVYLVMEYVAGDSLAGVFSRIRQAGAKIPLPIVGRIVADVLGGLHSAHELTGHDGLGLGLVHRDVSPHNVLIGLDGVARITDFGIAKTAVSTDSTAEGLVKGKVRYMAPEQVLGRRLDRRVDVWAVGVIAWELIAGLRLRQEASEAAIVLALGKPPPPLSGIRSDVPADIERAVNRALAFDPEERYASAQEFRSELVAAYQGIGGIADQPALATFVAEWTREATATAERRPSVPTSSA